MAGTDGYEALLATHIDPGWFGPDMFQENVERYIASEEYDAFIYLHDGEPRHRAGEYEEYADTVVRSEHGRIPSGRVTEFLDEYDAFTHIGAYWGMCHARSFGELVEGIADREAGRYRVSMPLDAVTSTNEIIRSYIDDAAESVYEDVARLAEDPMDDEVMGAVWERHGPELARLRVYGDIVESCMDQGEIRFEAVPDPVPTFTWLFEAGEQGGGAGG